MHKPKTRVLILGASGMLGSTLFRAFSASPDFLTFGSIRRASLKRYFAPKLHEYLISDVHLDGETALLDALEVSKPEVVINCIGIIKQLLNKNDNLESIAVNAYLPHRLAKYCDAKSARLIHFSTDCVFSGKQGNYKENDFPDANDLYGRTKLLGEVAYDNTITLRTSIIGHELNRSKSLVDWFLSQSGEVKGFTKAVFSGLPTIEIARVVMKYVIPNQHLNGLFHLSADPINKYDLLNLVATIYSKDIIIKPDDNLSIDRSLNSDLFRAATGYRPRSWHTMIESMQREYSLTL